MNPIQNNPRSNRVIFITGGGQGIGRGLVLHFLNLGYAVATMEIDNEAREELKLLTKDKGPCLILEGDVRSENDIQNALAQTLKAYGKLNAAIHNAAISANQPVESLTLDLWNDVLAVNLTAGFLIAKHATPHLKNSEGGGALLLLASTRAIMSEASTEAYSATKGGIVALTHALSVSLGPEIRVNCISPGWIETRDWQKSSKATPPIHSDEDKSQHPVGRVGIPDDIARTAAFLVDPQNGFITGQNVVVDGGMTKKMIYV
ncbi:SDR family oxidoreductase [Acidaminobacter hydrogenoformans]|uniref:NAD(P)-dependent dehydrogenase, short-chain alcohol dehydrogenase family n=1 Tax=Acidaminobacter hydrogenoformans DSM 2784 TaxID=1120920 RepID=A0A1G5RR53_9FIRM|nr:SDR family oxidoreductase [Acidaminobacter hydrogenoformans]SCZ76486.1 NAD(P)-dependent dehydrogenase, short-chain alcohol dehydrogenase family [Acidaminobacter hydrogenoformans DSM 2784]